MALKDTCKQMKTLLEEINSDLDKAENGNKAASQRVRTGTIKLEKIAKLYRKESIKSEKSGGGSSRSSSKKSSSSGAAKGKSSSGSSKSSGSKASSSKPAAKSSSKSEAGKKGGATSSKSKKGGTKTSVKPKSMAVKRPTAKLPRKKK